jgi:hypothetical protein
MVSAISPSSGHQSNQLACQLSSLTFFLDYVASVPILVEAWFKMWVCGSSLAGIEDSNPVGGMDVCLL